MSTPLTFWQYGPGTHCLACDASAAACKCEAPTFRPMTLDDNRRYWRNERSIMAGKRRKIVSVKINVGKKCSTCGRRYLNPFTHTCRVKFGVVGKRRIEKKGK